MRIMVIWFLLFLATLLVLSSATATTTAYNKTTENPADELVTIINNNRTAHKVSSLHDSPGLGCIALQYIKAYQGQCSVVGGSNAKKPADSEFAESFAPSCGVEVATLSNLTGRFLGCQSKYVHPSEAFSSILIENEKSIDILYSKNHTQLGAAVSGSDGGSPYFWCVLFSGGEVNTTFVLEDGVAKITRPGCFSGMNDDCSRAHDMSPRSRSWVSFAGWLLAIAYALGA